MSSFFYPKLCSAGYNGVRRWTKKVPHLPVSCVNQNTSSLLPIPLLYIVATYIHSTKGLYLCVLCLTWFRMYPPLSLPKVDVFAHDIILIPIHLGMHWCLATIHFRQQQFQYFDSLGGGNLSCLNRLRCAAIRSWNLTETILASVASFPGPA